MYKKLIFSMVILFALIGCENTDKIMIDHTTQYVIPTGMSAVHVSQMEINYYKSLFDASIDNPVVLYKVLKGDNFKIYIGIGYETPIEELKVKTLSALKSKMVSCDSTDLHAIKIFAKMDPSVHIVHYLKQFDSGNKYIFSAISYNENVINEQFVINYFDKQFINQ